MTSQRCPNCEETSLRQESPGVFRCGHCRARIVQGELQCPSCRTLNPIGNERCSECAEPLTIFGRVISRQDMQAKSPRLGQMRDRVHEIKAKAEASSEVRMAGFREIDQRRIDLEREQLLAQDARDRRLFRNVAVGLGLFMLVIAIISLVILL